jgi:NAD(P)-dependent dehydrogenase (short-subunit alcohol dehydrogenase family)
MTTPVVLLTGASDGIGRAAAQIISAMPVRLLLHGRDPDKLSATAEACRGAPETLTADFSRLAEVRRLAEAVAARVDGLDVLIHNAGIGDEEARSTDGFDLTMAVNYLAPFALTGLLLEPLKARAGKVVSVASEAQSRFDVDDPGLTSAWSGGSYGKSKLAQIMWTFELAARSDTASAGIRAVALHPGTLLDTSLVRRHYGRALGPAEEGGEAVAYVALDPEVADATGVYFNQKRRSEPSADARDPEARRRLWVASEAVTGVRYRLG